MEPRLLAAAIGHLPATQLLYVRGASPHVLGCQPPLLPVEAAARPDPVLKSWRFFPARFWDFEGFFTWFFHGSEVWNGCLAAVERFWSLRLFKYHEVPTPLSHIRHPMDLERRHNHLRIVEFLMVTWSKPVLTYKLLVSIVVSCLSPEFT